ncbi:MAG TPA: transglycosylase domain-containing protein, partial [Bacilli bacterium]|nr:transglycosylase domain-containing protein [Bacilli bacterium]
MKKFKRKFKKFIRITKKILSDKQLLGIVLLIVAVIATGIVVIGIRKTLLIMFGLLVIGLIFKWISNKRNPDKKAVKKSNKTLSIILNIFLIFILICIISGIGFIVYVAVSAPEFNPSNLYSKESSTVYDSDGEVIAKLGSEIRETITYDDMPQVLIDAIIATEDSRYYQHNGVDLPRFIKAAVGQLLGNSSAGGGSTISMQVIKQCFTSSESSGIKGIIRKFTDIYMAIFKLEKNYTKEEILEYYVNVPFLGSNSYGVAEAAETYFGKDVSELNLSEAALIAGLFQSPTYYDPYTHPDNAAERRAVVLRLMVRHGYITEEQEEMANAISVESLLSTKAYTNPYQSFIDVVIDEIYDKTGENPYNTPMKIYTTLDRDKQDYLNEVIDGGLFTWSNEVVQTGVAVTDVETGAILAISGGRNVTAALTFNRATMLNNQPGSTAKPIFDYGPGVEYNNWSTYTPFIDEEWSYSSGIEIQNWDSGYYGFLTLKRALGLSRNIPALKAFQNVDNSDIYEFVTSLGITPEDSEDGYVFEAHALGAFNGVSPLEMAAAYAAFGNGGYYIEPYSVTKIVYLDTNQTKEYQPTKTKAMSDSTAYIITKSLIWATNSGLSYGAKISGYEVAAKTGTTNFDEATKEAYNLSYNAVKDYWVVGYTPNISIGLWYGYDVIDSEYYNTTGADNNRKSALFNLILKGMISDSDKTFSMPKSVTAVNVELGTIPAMLPSENTPEDQISLEYFKAGTEPTEVSPRYQTLSNPNNLNVSVSNNVATLSWDAVDVPNYFTEQYMNTYYTDGMG